jgi:hypothetical protein
MLVSAEIPGAVFELGADALSLPIRDAIWITSAYFFDVQSESAARDEKRDK